MIMPLTPSLGTFIVLRFLHSSKVINIGKKKKKFFKFRNKPNRHDEVGFIDLDIEEAVFF